jgi:hypothetical protein
VRALSMNAARQSDLSVCISALQQFHVPPLLLFAVNEFGIESISLILNMCLFR